MRGDVSYPGKGERNVKWLEIRLWQMEVTNQKGARKRDDRSEMERKARGRAKKKLSGQRSFN